MKIGYIYIMLTYKQSLYIKVEPVCDPGNEHERTSNLGAGSTYSCGVWAGGS